MLKLAAFVRSSGFRLIVVLTFAIAVLASVERNPVTLAQAPPALAVTAMNSPAGANSSEPQMSTQGDRVLLSWIETKEEHATLKFSERTASGWSAAKTVTSGDDFFINAADVPAVYALADGTLAAEWLQTSGDDPDSDAYNVRLAWSKDQGKTWSRPVSPHHDGTKTQHGFVSLFQAPGQGLGLVWLDGRATNPETESGNMSLRASVYDQDGKQLSQMLVDSRVCDCCSTSTAQTSDGIIVAYRDRSANEIRDIYVSRFADGRWSAPAVVHNDGWRIEACPINGPAVSAHDRDVVVAWFTAKDDQGRSFVAFSHDAGRTFGNPVRVDDVSSHGRVGVQLLGDGSAAVTWIEFANGRSQFKVRTITPAGVRSSPITLSEAVGSSFPRLAHDRDELLFSWAESGQSSSQVRTARLALPTK